MSEKPSLLFQVRQKVREVGVLGFIKSLIPLDPVYEGESKLCVQCHSPISPDFEFCSLNCEIKYLDEFNRLYNFHSGKTPLCKFPRCFNSCYVEDNGHIHDYCSKSHAGEHKKMKEAAERQQRAAHRGGGQSRAGNGRTSARGRNGSSRGAWSHQGGGDQGHHQHEAGHVLGGTYCSSAPWRNTGPIHFYNRGEPYYEFTNFYIGTKFILDNSEWPTTEHYFQAQKFVGTPYVHKIRNAFGPRDAFDLSRNPAISRWRRSDWEDVKMDVMRKALFAKFTSHTFLKNKLLETDKRELVERSPHDSYWGDGGDGTGENHLGRLLMELRAKLQGGQYNDIERDGGMQATQRGTSASQSSQTSSSTCVAKGSGYQAMKMSGGLPPSDELTRAPLHGTSSNTQEDVEEMDTSSEDDAPNGSPLDTKSAKESCDPLFPPHLQLRPLSNPTPPVGADAVSTQTETESEQNLMDFSD